MRVTQYELVLDDQIVIKRNDRPNRKLHGEWVAVLRRGVRSEEVMTGSLDELYQRWPGARIENNLHVAPHVLG